MLIRERRLLEVEVHLNLSVKQCGANLREGIRVWPSSRTVVFKGSRLIYPLHIDYLEIILCYGFTRAQLDTLSREQLAEELIKCLNIADQLKILTHWFNDFVCKYDKWQTELVISKNCNSLLVNRIINLKRYAMLSV